MDLSIYEIADACKGKLVIQKAAESETVSGVVLDSRKLTPGGVFIATVGERVDGHKFIPQVFGEGAALVVTEKSPEQVEAEHNVPAAKWGSYVLVENSFQALKDIGEYYRKKLNIPIVGITGSVGKTSTKEFIASVLAQKFCVFRTEENFNNEVGVPLMLLSIRREHEIAVLEMGISDFGEMHRLSKMVRPNVCVITNIGQCHLENLGSRDGILKAKTEIFDYMAPDGEICLNGEDDKLRTVTAVKRGASAVAESGDNAETPGETGMRETADGIPRVYGLGGCPGQRVWVSDIVNKGLKGSDALLHIKRHGENSLKEKAENAADEEIFPIYVPVPGNHMVLNAAAAACVADIFGLSKEQIRAGIDSMETIAGRNNLLWLENCTVIDDCYNANPVSMKAGIDLLGLSGTYRTAILGDMFELGTAEKEMHADVGAYAALSGADCILCVGTLSKHMYEGALEQKKRLQDTQKTTNQKILYFPDKDSLLQALTERKDELLPAGCTVLVKASHGMEFAKVVEWLKENL